MDPLVGKTGTPYLYANGNPTTLTDSDGLCSRQGALSGHCVQGAPGSGSGTTTSASASTDSATSSATSSTTPAGVTSTQSAAPAVPIEELYGPKPGDDFEVVCGPPSGPATSQTPGSCGWAKSSPGLGQLLLDAITSEEFLSFAKNLGVAVIAVAGGAMLCGATAGAGCIVVASAAVGAAANVGAEEALDCAYRQCGEFSADELTGDLVQGAVIGGSTAALNTQLASLLGSSSPIGIVPAALKYGIGPTAAAITDQGIERVGVTVLKHLLERTFGGS